MNLDLIRMETDLIGYLFVLSNKLQVLADNALAADDLTAKQWLLLATVERFFDEPPGIKDVALVLGSSHQNIKQLALKLESKGFVTLLKDPTDKRRTCIQLTDKVSTVFSRRYQDDYNFVSGIFSDFDYDSIKVFHELIEKLNQKLTAL